MADRSPPPRQLWNIWIDTGGTFTDCVARDPQGNLHRAKVLSTGALRGRVQSQIDATRVVVNHNWNGCDDLIAGFEFQLLNARNWRAHVIGFDAAKSMIQLDQPVPQSIEAGTAFEVHSGEPAPALVARLVTATPSNKPLPPLSMRLATTRGTNALLERRGAPTALFITQGFGDLLLIGDQQRPDLFALHIQKPPPLHDRVVEVRQRMAADGSILIPLDLDHLSIQAKSIIVESGIRAGAIAFLHSHINPADEQHAAELLRRLGFEHVSCSSDLAPLIRILPRAQTALVNAYLSPIIEGYLRDVAKHLGDHEQTALHVMTSAGGLVRAERYRACDSLLSGPAGGVGGAAAAGRQSGITRIIGFDMGGTSTDVARLDGDFEYRFEQQIAGVRLMAPALAIETVAAGGDQFVIASMAGQSLGRSAGANPGPACYGAGGPLTLTDVNLLLGRLSAEQFEIPIQRDAAKRAWNELRGRMEMMERAKPQAARSAKPEAADGESVRLLAGFLDIANERMAAAIEQISIRQGYDPKAYALVAFGGAGGQHACAVAQRLGIQTIIMPADASLLSAIGLGHAAIERFAQRQILLPLDECQASLPQWIDELCRQAIHDVAAEGVVSENIIIRRIIINLRLLGQDATLAIECKRDSVSLDDLRRAFVQRYRVVYGHEPPAQSRKPIEVESLRVVASGTVQEHQLDTEVRRVEPFDAPIVHRTNAFFDGVWNVIPVFDRTVLRNGARVRGPAIVLDRRSTCVIESGWNGVVDGVGTIVLKCVASDSVGASLQQSKAAPQPDVILLELFTNRLVSIADEMGQMLQRTALSTNVKERLDFSCAVLDAQGELIVNAPHIPVHLGSIGMCVRALRDVIEMHDGDVVVTNHPAFGGSHLPDVTVVMAVFRDGSRELQGFVANRAHHAEIGGTWPGSMPPSAKTLAEEGVVISPRYLVQRGKPCFDEIEDVLRSAHYPSRAVEDNMADLHAQVAANHRGAAAMRTLCDQYGESDFAELMASIKERAYRLTRDALRKLPQARYKAVERLDDGSPIHVTIELAGERAVIDFTGTAGVHAGNLNATPAIVRSAVIYVLRLLIGQRLPLNEGIMRAVDVRIPPGMLNPHFDVDPERSPAVVGGNTETSQRTVDTLLKALKLCACSQGTMNNVVFGNDRFGYYETVCGGSGAGPLFDGADAVHTHMTNTRITDPEIIEHRYPVRVERFAIRRNSGGTGMHRGGDGAVRELTFLQPMSLAVLGQHRVEQPFGLDGGAPGATAGVCVIRASGERVELKSIDGIQVCQGDRFILQTPGGGGFGR